MSNRSKRTPAKAKESETHLLCEEVVKDLEKLINDPYKVKAINRQSDESEEEQEEVTGGETCGPCHPSLCPSTAQRKKHGKCKCDYNPVSFRVEEQQGVCV